MLHLHINNEFISINMILSLTKLVYMAKFSIFVGICIFWIIHTYEVKNEFNNPKHLSI